VIVANSAALIWAWVRPRVMRALSRTRVMVPAWRRLASRMAVWSWTAAAAPSAVAATSGRVIGEVLAQQSHAGNKYTHVFLAAPVALAGMALGDTEIEKYFDMSVVLIPAAEAMSGIGTVITSMETVGALMAARLELPSSVGR
jgi:hypothetical protein